METTLTKGKRTKQLGQVGKALAHFFRGGGVPRVVPGAVEKILVYENYAARARENEVRICNAGTGIRDAAGVPGGF